MTKQMIIRNIIKRFLPALIVTGLVSASSILLAQKSITDSLLLKSDLYREKFHIFTDRNLYPGYKSD
jgi:hypothetical protein